MFYLGPWVLTQLALGMGKAVGSRSTSISSTCCGCIKVKVLVAQLCLTFCDPMNCSPPGSSVHGILQARILEWVAIPFSRESFGPRDRTPISCIAIRFFTIAPSEHRDLLSHQMWMMIPSPGRTLGRTMGLSLAGPLPC